MPKVIKSTGPDRCDVMCVAERPGIVESRKGYVLCGPSGEEFDRFLLTESGIDRASVHCSNIVRDFRDNENPDPWEVYRDWPLFVEEIQQVGPRFVALVGLWAARAVLGPDIDIEVFSGCVFPYQRCSSCGQIYPKGFEPNGGIKRWLLDLDRSYCEGWVRQQEKEAAIHVREGDTSEAVPASISQVRGKGSKGQTVTPQVREHSVHQSVSLRASNSTTTSQKAPEVDMLSRAYSSAKTSGEVPNLQANTTETVEHPKRSTEIRVQQAMGRVTSGACQCSKSGIQKATPISFMPITHPSATLHQPKYAARCAWDFRQFGRLVKGLPLPTGHLSKPMPTTYTDNVIGIESVVAMDTEGTVERPWGLSYSCRPGVASVQNGRRHRKWDCENMDKALVVGHNLLHDLPVLAKLGVRPRQFTDTMLMAALLGTEPLGLKALARRWCGMKMLDYDDVVREARREKALDYLGRVLEWRAEQQKG